MRKIPRRLPKWPATIKFMPPQTQGCDPTHSANALKIYEIAKSCIGRHITLDESVPHELGCAEALSYVLSKVPCGFPIQGFADTALFCNWLIQSPDFQAVTEPQYGDVIVSPRAGQTHGHIGIVAKYGILSNDSASGLFLELFDLRNWRHFFGEIRGLPIRFFRAV